MGKGKKKTQADVPTPSVAPVIQKKGAGKPKCTSSEIDDIFGVAKSASAIPPPASSIPHTEQANASSSPQQKPSKRPKTSSSTALDEGDEEEDDITDDLQLLAERIRKNRQDKADKVSSHNDQYIHSMPRFVLS